MFSQTSEGENVSAETSVEQSSENGSMELHISEADLSSEQPSPQVEKKKTIEEIVSQLLMQNKEFQRVLKKQRHITARRHRVETSDEEDEGSGGIPHSRSTRSLSTQREGDYDNLQNVWESARCLESTSLKRAQSFTSQVYEEHSSTDVSLSGSQMSFDGPTSPAVWLKQQRQHLAIPTPGSLKAGSLPRGFQLGTPDWHRARISPDRPFTIASDKAQELNLEDMQRYCDSQHDQLVARHRFPLPDDTTEEDSTPDASTQHLNVHPEYKIYRPSLTKATLKQVISSVSSKLANLRLSSETLDEVDDSQRTNKLMTAFAKTFVKKKTDESSAPFYKQGSSALGARIAQGSETSDYADPRTLFPNITNSKKAASLLGIRPYSVLSLVSNLTSSSSSGYAASNSSKCPKGGDTVEEADSDGSADSYYERSFEAIESTMLNDVCRDSAIFSDPEETFAIDTIVTKVRKKKVPPPVPEKPPSLRWRPPIDPPLPTGTHFPASPSPLNSPGQDSSSPCHLDDEYDSSSVASTVIDTTTTKGWVKHVIGKIQGDAIA